MDCIYIGHFHHSGQVLYNIVSHSPTHSHIHTLMVADHWQQLMSYFSGGGLMLSTVLSIHPICTCKCDKRILKHPESCVTLRIRSLSSIFTSNRSHSRIYHTISRLLHLTVYMVLVMLFCSNPDRPEYCSHDPVRGPYYTGITGTDNVREMTNPHCWFTLLNHSLASFFNIYISDIPPHPSFWSCGSIDQNLLPVPQLKSKGDELPGYDILGFICCLSFINKLSCWQ